MSTRVWSLLSAAVVLLVALVAACSSSTKPTPVALASLLVSCDTSRLTSFGQQARCTARASLSNGQTEDRTAVAQWSSSDPSKVSVAGGVATAVAPGSADITARVDSVSAKQTVSVDVGCAFSVSPPVAAFGAGGGSQIVAVSASPAGCEPSNWTAVSNGPGLSVSPSQGSGSGSVTVTAEPNGTQAQARTATIAGQIFTANMGAACTVGFSPAGSDNVGSGAGERQVAVSVTNGPCRWTAVSSDPWITVSQAEGTASTTVRLSFARNTGGDRTGSVTFTGPDCNPQCRNSLATVAIKQARGMGRLVLTLEQGENLSGPYEGSAAGPNGFTCSIRLSEQRVQCPAIEALSGTSVTFVITITFVGDRPIYRPRGCDSLTLNSCTVVMNGDRNVTIGVGCSTCADPIDDAPAPAELRNPAGNPAEPEQLVVGPWPSLRDADGDLHAEEAERHAVAAVAEREGLAWMRRMPADARQIDWRRHE